MFQLSNEFKDNLKGRLRRTIDKEELETGLEAFEKLLKIETPRDNDDPDTDFNVKYGELLNKSDNASLDFLRFDHRSGIRLEGFLKKLEMLKGNDISGITLNTLYNRIGFFDKLNLSEVKQARAKDPENARNAGNERNKEGFKLAMADARQYQDCPGYFDSYIMVYQWRNPEFHGVDYEPDQNTLNSLFIVYLDQCIINSQLINEQYNEWVEKKVLGEAIDYKRYAEERIGQMAVFDERFVQLKWHTDHMEQAERSNAAFSIGFDKPVKFIGEPGLGKTTQMREVYYDKMKRVRDGQEKLLPVWVDLFRLQENGDSLEEMIKQSLGEYEQYYELLLKKAAVMLFLDGYNEYIMNRANEEKKKKLAIDIDEIHRKYPDVFIAVTDRVKRSVPSYLSDNDTRIYVLDGMSEQEMKAYVQRKTEGIVREKLLAFLENEKSLWFREEEAVIPQKMENLIGFMEREDVIPENRNVFYQKYYDIVMNREADEKKETRIEHLKRLLRALVSGELIKSETDEADEDDILDFWQSRKNLNWDEAEGFLRLAKQLHILTPGSAEGTLKFTYPEYYQKVRVFRNGLNG